MYVYTYINLPVSLYISFLIIFSHFIWASLFLTRYISVYVSFSLFPLSLSLSLSLRYLFRLSSPLSLPLSSSSSSSSDCLILWLKRSRQYPEETIADTDYADDLSLLTNTAAQVESPLHHLDPAAGGIALYPNLSWRKFLCFKQNEATINVSGKPLRFLDQFRYLDRNISSIERDINKHLMRAWDAMNK